ncbi:unnamed protein product, partial [Prorocentrum cordatum]
DFGSEHGLEKLGQVYRELLELGPQWPATSAEDGGLPLAEQKLVERLGRQLPKFTEEQQRDLVAAFAPLREETCLRMADVAERLGGWLCEVQYLPSRSVFIGAMALTLESMKELLAGQLKSHVDPINEQINILSNAITSNMETVKRLDQELNKRLDEQQQAMAEQRAELERQAAAISALQLGQAITIDSEDELMSDSAHRGRPPVSASPVVDAELTARVLQLEEKLASTVASSSPSVNSDPWSDYARRRGAAPAQPLAAPPTGHDHGERNKKKIWIRGFPRKLMQTTFKSHFAIVKSKMPAQYSEKCRVQAQNYKFSYNIQFDEEDDALLFHTRCRADPSFLTWTDPRSAEVVQLRVGWDQPQPIRHRSYALGQCWQIMLDALKEQCLWLESMKLGSNPFTGHLHLYNSANEEVWDLVKISEDAQGTFIIVPLEDCHVVGLSKEFIDSLA